VEDLLLEQELLFVVEHAADGSSRPSALPSVVVTPTRDRPSPSLGAPQRRRAADRERPHGRVPARRIVRGMDIRTARSADVEQITDTIAAAFATDPVWEVALRRADGRTDHHRAYWRLFVADAVELGSVRLADEGAAVAVWIPPDATELTPATAAALDAFNVAALGERGAAEMSELYERFEANHPVAPAHAYLSLLATHPEHRGHGIGQLLLAANLADWDRLGVPAYLESTNPGNDDRYVRAGFRAMGSFRAVRDEAPITTMWRAIGGG
jgi:GNAT superfamily N-acetyltransferase